MKILNKKVYRELFKYNKARSFAIVLTLTLTVGFLFGLANAKGVFFNSYDLNMAKLNTPTLRLNYNTYIDDSNLTALWANHKAELQQAGINMTEGRLTMHVSANYKNRTYDAVWIALNSTKDNPNQIDKLRIVSGVNYFSNETDALMIYQFAQGLVSNHHVHINDTVNLSLENKPLTPLTIKGIVQSNEYTYVVDDRTGAPTLGSMPIIYTSLEYAWTQLNLSHIINQILVSTNQRTKQAGIEALSVISPILTSQKAPIYNAVSFLNTPDRKFFDADAGSIDKFAVVLGGFALAIGVILIYNSLTKLINSQRKYIGLLGAMGSDRRTIMYHYTTLGIILGIIGVIFGLFFSLLITYGLSYLLFSFYGFHYIAMTFDPLLLVGGVAVTLITITFFSFLACLPILDITPREAMTSTYTRVALNARPILEKVLKKFPGFRGILASVPLRETFMNKKRSSLTIVAIAVSTIILVVSGAMMVDLIAGVQTNFTVYNNYDGKVILNTPDTWNNVSNTIDTNFNQSQIKSVEPYLFLPIGVNSTQKFLGYTPLEVTLHNSSMRKFHVIKGSLPTLNTNEVLIGQVSARDWKVGVGSQLVLFDPNLGLSTMVKVSGIVGELIDTYIYTYFSNLDYVLHAPQMFVNGFLFKMPQYNSSAFTTLSNTIYKDFNVYQLINSHTAFETTQALFEVLIEFSSLFMGVGILMVVAFTFNTIYVSYSDREMEYLALRAQGLKRRSLLKILGIETILLGIVGFALSIPLSYLASIWGFQYMMGNNYYVEVYIPLWMWASLFVLVMGSVLLASLLVARRINKAKLPDVLRNRQIG